MIKLGTRLTVELAFGALEYARLSGCLQPTRLFHWRSLSKVSDTKSEDNSVH